MARRCTAPYVPRVAVRRLALRCVCELDLNMHALVDSGDSLNWDTAKSLHDLCINIDTRLTLSLLANARHLRRTN